MSSQPADLRVSLGRLELPNPIMVASGTFGYAREMAGLVDLSRLGAIVPKTVTRRPRAGNAPWRTVETTGGMLNSIGLDNDGAEAFITGHLRYLASLGAKIVVSVAGSDYDDFVGLAAMFDGVEGVAALELNVSCPNVSHGVDFGTDPAMCEKVVRGARNACGHPILAKLTPNVTRIVDVAEAAARGGADALTVINTCLGMAVDWRGRRPLLGNVLGGLSGPAIKPIALAAVYRIAQAAPAPIIGVGGIATIDDVMEFLVAGAAAVQIGTANFYDPTVSMRVLDALPGALAELGAARVADVVNTLGQREAGSHAARRAEPASLNLASSPDQQRTDQQRTGNLDNPTNPKQTIMRVLSGIQPTGRFHWGNYFGAIRQYIDLQDEDESYYFIANLHALTTIRDPRALKQLSLDAALDLLALGLDPGRATLFLQSDVPAVSELCWLLLTGTPMGLLERCVAYKDKKAKGLAADAGLFSYPVLMAADILAYDSDVVPVGADQIQHIEVCRDIAASFNHQFGETFVLPKPKVLDDSAKVPGTDGEKMSKSYNNTIGLFEEPKAMRKKIMRITTDSRPMEEPKEPEGDHLYQLYSLFANDAQREEMAALYRRGGFGYGQVKKALADLAEEFFAEPLARRAELAAHPERVREILGDGAAQARQKADQVLLRAQTACGVK